MSKIRFKLKKKMTSIVTNILLIRILKHLYHFCLEGYSTNMHLVALGSNFPQL